MTAIIGECGSGKSSLLDIVSGYRPGGFSGLVLMDGVLLDSKTLIKRTCYIQQKVILQPLLNTYEAVMFTVNLVFSSTIPLEEKRARVSNILKKSMLSNCENTLTKNLSGGERQRLALALELVSNPCTILLDELITGLDSRSARECLKMLRDLSNEGRTVVCSVHQPSMQTLQLFDNLYIMWRGRCVYQGTVGNLVPFLEANGFECPRYHNPTEYLLELCTLTNGERNGQMLVETIDNGRSLDWMTQADLGDENEEIPARASSSVTPKLVRQPTTFTRPSFVYQLRCIMTRKYFTISRNFLCWLVVITSIAEGLGFGILFYDKGKDARWMIFNYNMIFFIIVGILFNGLTSQIIRFPLEMQLTRRECLNGWYSLTAYWLSLSLSIIPVITNCIPPITYSQKVMAYERVFLDFINSCYGCNFLLFSRIYPSDKFRVVRFLAPLVLLAVFSQDYGILLGTLFSTQKGLVFGVLTTMPFMMTSGFFTYYRDCRLEVCRWTLALSPMRMVFHETLFSAYGYDRGKLHCDNLCTFRKPKDFFQHVDLIANEDTFWNDLTYIVLLCVVMKLAVLTAMKNKCSRGV